MIRPLILVSVVLIAVCAALAQSSYGQATRRPRVYRRLSMDGEKSLLRSRHDDREARGHICRRREQLDQAAGRSVRWDPSRFDGEKHAVLLALFAFEQCGRLLLELLPIAFHDEAEQAVLLGLGHALIGFEQRDLVFRKS